MSSALEADVVGAVDAVRSASARVMGDPTDTDIDLRVELDEDAPATEVRRAVEQDVLPRFARAASLRPTSTYLEVRLRPPDRQIV